MQSAGNHSVDTIELDACKLKVSEIICDDRTNPKYEPVWMYNEDTTKLLIIPKQPIEKSDSVIISIKYVYDYPYNKGFAHRNSQDTDTTMISDADFPNICTLNETKDARWWFPCNDRPSDKALFETYITVPVGFYPLSNGDRILWDFAETGYSDIFGYESKYPMPTYLFTLLVYPLSDIDRGYYKIATNSAAQDSIVMSYYTWHNDYAGNDTFYAKPFLDLTEKTMQIFSDRFGNYPFDQYSIATADFRLLGYGSLGMEHQTLTTISRSWFKWNQYTDASANTGFAHELAHHWFGNYVTCNTWKDLWWNEGGSSWLEAIFAEDINEPNDRQAYYDKMKMFRTVYMYRIENEPEKYWNTSMYGLDDDTAIFKLTYILYQKASWVFHQLREIYGDEQIFSMFNILLYSNQYGNISTERFIDYFDIYLNEIGYTPPEGLNIRSFLEKWIYGAGHPRYEIDFVSATASNDYTAQVKLEQVQEGENVADVFDMYLQLIFLDEDDNAVDTIRVVNNQKAQTYTFHLEHPAASVYIDDNVSLQETVKYTSVTSDATHLVSIYPNPTNDWLYITAPDNINSIKIVDVTGNTIQSEMNINATNYILNVSNLMNGSYFIILDNNIFNPTPFTIIR
jgi:aminopeptidase N